jgi:hypothetical protein
MTVPTIDQELAVVEDLELVRDTLTRVRDAHTEVSLGDFVEQEEETDRPERRSARRAELHVPVLLIPVEWSPDSDDHVVVCGPEQLAVTRDVSPTGLGITHDELIGSDLALVQIDVPGEGQSLLVLDVRWSVRKSRYSHMSGGRIIGQVVSDS